MEGKSNLAAHLHTSANVEVLDETHALFGDLYTPEQVWSSLWGDDDNNNNNNNYNNNDDLNVGMPTGTILCSQDLPCTTFLNSKYEMTTPHEIPVEIHNTTIDWTVRVRWIDSMGHNDSISYLWNIAPSSTLEQYTKPGHLFVLSLLPTTSATATTTTYNNNNVTDSGDELILGAYRPKRALPSGTPHCVLVHGGNGSDNDDAYDDAYDNNPSSSSSLFLLETLLLDESKFDALSVAAFDLDHRHCDRRQDRQMAFKSVQMLQTILQNAIVRHPTDEKYRKLRLGNPKIQQYIASSWGAMEILKIVGFVPKSLPLHQQQDQQQQEESNNNNVAVTTITSTTPETEETTTTTIPEEDLYLILPTPATAATAATPAATKESTQQQQMIGKCALDILNILQTRLAPDFIPDIAPPTPWQDVGIYAGSGGSTSASWNNHHNNNRGFITDEERWARAERIAGLRRSGAARRPAPGEAPSSRGKWGR